MTEAALEAAENRAANLCALSISQPELSERLGRWSGEIEWVYGRDGALTVLRDGQWWTDCSVPRRAGEAMLKSLEAKGNVACYLWPAHPVHLKTVLNRLGPDQAVIVVWPDLEWARIGIGCCDFSAEIATGRLWLACGEDWAAELALIFENEHGLASPQLFVRTGTLDEQRAGEMIPAAQRVFGEVGEKRAAAARWAAEAWVERRPAKKICVMARSRFRLWEGDALHAAKTLGGQASNQVVTVDLDDPRQASTLMLAELASGCDALVMVNAGRADLSVGLPRQMPVITWVTVPRIPAFSAERDALMLVDPAWRELAVNAGWPKERIVVATRPALEKRRSFDAAPTVAIVADTSDLCAQREFEYSSHKLLWEMIAEELGRDPFALGEDVNDFLSNRMKRMGISQEGLDRPLFIDALIVPAWQQGLARAALNAGVPLRVYGKGWGDIADFTPCFGGEIDGDEDLEKAVGTAAGLIHVWPVAVTHPIESVGRPVVRALGRKRGGFVDELRRLVSGATPAKSADVHSSALSWDIIQHLTS